MKTQRKSSKPRSKPAAEYPARCVLWFVLMTCMVCNIQGDTLPMPGSGIVLTVTGNISHTNLEGEARFDLPMLENIGTERVSTDTPWTDGEHDFEGVSVRAFVEYIGALGKQVHAVALNDYAVLIPVKDLIDSGALMAFKQNGDYMRVRDYGPIWIIFPIKDHPDLRDDYYRNFWIWQLKSLHFQ